MLFYVFFLYKNQVGTNKDHTTLLKTNIVRSVYYG